MLCPADTQSYVLTNTGNTVYPSFYVDVTDVVDLKVKAIQMMKSQKYNTEGYAKKTTEQWNGNFGQKIRVAYAEAFAFEYPEIGETISISEHRMWLANGDEGEHLKNQSGLQAQDVELD
jgi:LmbE family N-acetylglucosaminyl deacetylase